MNIELLLIEISEVSDLCYQEGGVYYTYQYFHRCAHANSNTDLVELYQKLENRDFSGKESKDIEAFVRFSLCEHHSDSVSNKAPEYSSKLIALLNEFDRVKVTNYYVDDHDCKASISIEAVTNNNGHKWVLNWSID